MKVEKLVGYKPYSTFSEVKNAQINGGFTHRITYSYTDFTPTDALTATVNANLFKNAAGASKGLLDGMQVGHVAMYVKAAFSGIANQTSGANGAKFNFGPTGNTDAFIDDKGVEWERVWTAPTTSIGLQNDADSSQQFVDKTKGWSVGDMWDYSKEMSEKRKDKRGHDHIGDAHEKKRQKKIDTGKASQVKSKN